MVVRKSTCKFEATAGMPICTCRGGLQDYPSEKEIPRPTVVLTQQSHSLSLHANIPPSRRTELTTT